MTQIVAAHVGKNQVPVDRLIALIHSVHAALAGASDLAPAAADHPESAVPIRRSVFPDYIVCLEDGKMLKRHLLSAFNMTPDEYRARWGLPSAYPMVAPNYAERRSVLTKSIGLERKVAPGRPEPEMVKPNRKCGGKTGAE